jgi:hypothetical protein
MQLIILLIIVGFSVLSFIFRKVQEEAERRRVREQLAQRELDRLRTGRDPGSDVESATQMQRAQELAARRQAQLQELRRRQQERTRQQQTHVRVEEARMGPRLEPAANGPATSQPPLVWIPGSSGPTVPQRTPPTVRRTPGAGQPQGRPRPQPFPRTQPLPRPQTVARPTTQPKAAPRKPLFPSAPPAPPPPKQVTPAREAYVQRTPTGPILASIKPRTREEWRRAMILHEMLSSPVAMRPEHLT